MSEPSAAPERHVVVCIPTYDEAEALPVLVAALRAAHPGVHLLVVDDDSPDGTGRIADGLAAADPRVHVLHRQGKEGLGAAYRAGFAWALAHDADVVVEMDADGSHRPEDLGALLAAVDAGADLALGSRWVAGGRTVDWPRRRILLSRGGNAYAALVTGAPIADITGGFRAIGADLLRRIDPVSLASTGYAFQVEVALRAVDLGADVREVPIVFVERRDGVSKMSGAIVLEAMLRVTGWGLARRLRALRRAPDGGTRTTGAHP